MRVLWWLLGSVALLRARRHFRAADKLAVDGWDGLDDALEHEARARVLSRRAEEFFQRMGG